MYTNVDAGDHHTCAIESLSCAIYCWGLNSAGQLGDGTNINSNIPVLVAGGHKFINLSAGGDTTCAIQKFTKQIYCWGSDAEGTLGNGVPLANSNTPQLVSTPPGIRFASVHVGGQHVCAVAEITFDVYCWGSDTMGQLGNNAPLLSQPHPIRSGIASEAGLSTGAIVAIIVGSFMAFIIVIMCIYIFGGGSRRRQYQRIYTKR